MFGLFKKSEPKETYQDLISKFQKPVFQDKTSAPFRLQKEEEYIGSTTATLCLYKNDGRIAGHGITARVKIAKGIYYRAGAGRVGMNKSWQADQSGVLHFTTNRVIFDGSNKNFSVKWEKVLGLGYTPDGLQLSIDRESGADWLFVLEQPMPADQFSTVCMVEENRI